MGTIENIAYAGGGVKGYCYAGVIKYLEEKDILKDIKRISGTSIGSIIAILQVIGYSSQELQHIGEHLDLSLIQDFNISLLLEKNGFDSGNKVEKLMHFLLRTKGISGSVTFKELYEKFPIELFITCYDLEKDKEVVFTYKNTPDTKVVYACRCSMSVPLVWTPVDGRFVDGCIGNNLPLNLFPVEKTVGFYPRCIRSKSYNTLDVFITKILDCIFIKKMDLEIQSYSSKGYKVIEIQTEVSSTDFTGIKSVLTEQMNVAYNACSLHL